MSQENGAMSERGAGGETARREERESKLKKETIKTKLISSSLAVRGFAARCSPLAYCVILESSALHHEVSSINLMKLHNVTIRILENFDCWTAEITACEEFAH